MNALDLHVIRAALYDTRRMVQAGSSPEDAVMQVCHGAWREYQLIVYAALVNCVALPLPTQTPFAVSRGQRESLTDLYAFVGSRSLTASSMDAR